MLRCFTRCLPYQVIISSLSAHDSRRRVPSVLLLMTSSTLRTNVVNDGSCIRRTRWAVTVSRSASRSSGSCGWTSSSMGGGLSSMNRSEKSKQSWRESKRKTMTLRRDLDSIKRHLSRRMMVALLFLFPTNPPRSSVLLAAMENFCCKE